MLINSTTRYGSIRSQCGWCTSLAPSSDVRRWLVEPTKATTSCFGEIALILAILILNHARLLFNHTFDARMADHSLLTRGQAGPPGTPPARSTAGKARG